MGFKDRFEELGRDYLDAIEEGRRHIMHRQISFA